MSSSGSRASHVMTTLTRLYLLTHVGTVLLISIPTMVLLTLLFYYQGVPDRFTELVILVSIILGATAVNLLSTFYLARLTYLVFRDLITALRRSSYTYAPQQTYYQVPQPQQVPPVTPQYQRPPTTPPYTPQQQYLTPPQTPQSPAPGPEVGRGAQPQQTPQPQPPSSPQTPQVRSEERSTPGPESRPETQASVPPPQQREERSRVSGRRCPYCGRELPLGEVHIYCPYCGKFLV